MENKKQPKSPVTTPEEIEGVNQSRNEIKNTVAKLKGLPQGKEMGAAPNNLRANAIKHLLEADAWLERDLKAIEATNAKINRPEQG